MFGTFNASAGTSITGCRAQWHGTARLSHDSAVPGPLSRHGGTIRHGTANMSCRVVPCLAVPCQCRAGRPVWPYIREAEPPRAAPNEAKVHCSFMPSFRCLSRVFPLLSGVLILQLRVLLVSAFLTLRYSPCSFGLVWLISHS